MINCIDFEREGYCSHPLGVHSNGICPFKVAFGEGQMPRGHHFIGSDAVQRSARHGLNSNGHLHCGRRFVIVNGNLSKIVVELQ